MVCYYSEYVVDELPVTYMDFYPNDEVALEKSRKRSDEKHTLIALYKTSSRGLFTTILKEEKKDGHQVSVS